MRFREWERMRDGRRATRGVGRKHVADLYSALRGYEPKTASQIAFYGDAVSRLNDVVDARRTRLSAAAEEIPGPFGSCSSSAPACWSRRCTCSAPPTAALHTILVVAVAVITSFNLLIVVALDHPFSGDISVSDEPFDQGRPCEGPHITPADLDDR